MPLPRPVGQDVPTPDITIVSPKPAKVSFGIAPLLGEAAWYGKEIMASSPRDFTSGLS
jgi:hypothetical protein